MVCRRASLICCAVHQFPQRSVDYRQCAKQVEPSYHFLAHRVCHLTFYGVRIFIEPMLHATK